MPTLKHLTCNVEWTGSSIALQEFQTTYADGYVETYIAVPPIPTPFSVHLQSNSYIAPGLAMFVYVRAFLSYLRVSRRANHARKDGWCIPVQS